MLSCMFILVFWSIMLPPSLRYKSTGLDVVGLHGQVSKVKVTLVQALRLCTGCTAHRGSRGIALPFHDRSTRRGWGVSVTPRPLFTPGKDPVPIVQEAGWAPGNVWTGVENIAPTGIRSPDHPAHSQSLYYVGKVREIREAWASVIFCQLFGPLSSAFAGCHLSKTWTHHRKSPISFSSSRMM
jgi:hypothetical protein